MHPARQSSHDRFAVADEADAGAVRRMVARHADRLGARPTDRGRAELVATELATNLVRHAKPGGWVLVRTVPPAGIELLAVDHGPGIADLPAALDGRTATPGGLGCGLAAVRRASTHFDVHTAPGRGTTALSFVDLDDDGPAPQRRAWGGVSVGVTEVCGDGWAVAELDRCLAVAVVDGLGHGGKASAAADAALAAFAADPADLDGMVARANEAMRPTRGGAVTVCLIEPGRGELRYFSVGNVSGRVVSGSAERGLIFASGTLGLKIAPPRVKVLSLPWPADATLVLWTDGLSTRVRPSADLELLSHDPTVVAATLHREHTRERDDATVVVVRNQETQ
jgi:anti-sigma regulatory factor (Ser/Thr protein kinase)